MTTSITISMQPNALAVTTYVDAYHWLCEECGWTGLDLTTSEAAVREAGQHWDLHHADLPRGEIELEPREVSQ